MIDKQKRKNDDYSALQHSSKQTSSRPVFHWYNLNKHYQFYVDAAPSICLAHLKKMDSLSRADISYHITPLTAQSGKAFRVLRTEQYGRSAEKTVVTVHLDPYDLDNLRTFVTVHAVLVGPGLMMVIMFLGVLCFLTVLASLASGSWGFLVIMGGFILSPLVPAAFFIPNRRRTLDLVANHLALLRKNDHKEKRGETL